MVDFDAKRLQRIEQVGKMLQYAALAMLGLAIYTLILWTVYGNAPFGTSYGPLSTFSADLTSSVSFYLMSKVLVKLFSVFGN